MRAGFELILEWGANMADLSGGASGLLVHDHKGKRADRLVTRADLLLDHRFGSTGGQSRTC